MSKNDENNGPNPEELAEQFAQHVSRIRQDIWSRDDTGHDLTLEEQLFCRSYIIDRNPVAALRRLDYAGDNDRLRRIANTYLSNPEVQDCVNTLASKIMSRLEISAESVMRNIAAMAFFDPRTVMQWQGGTMQILDSKFWPDEAIAAVSGIKMTKDAGLEIKFVDKLKANEILARQLNLLEDPEVSAQKQQAEAAAERAVSKILEISERIRSAPPRGGQKTDVPTIN